MLEIGVIKLGADDFNTQFWVLSKVLLVRSVFLAAAAFQILRSIFTYKYATHRPSKHNVQTTSNYCE
jgi:hypothetical protein